MVSQRMLTGIVLVFVLVLCGYFAGGGSLEPSAGPASTMHTLDELYEISAAIAQPKRYVTRASGQVPQAFVRFEGVTGESRDVDHVGWSEIVTFHQGQKMPIEGMGATRQPLPTQMDDVSVVKILDKASPKLAEAVCTGRNFAKVDIDVTKMTESGRTSYLRYELRNVLVSSYNLVGSDADAASRPVEEVSLNFEQITMIYTELNAMGQPLGDVEYTWIVNQPR